MGLLVAAPRVLVEADAELRWTLEDVEQLAERQPQERDDDGSGVKDGEELVAVAAHPGVAGGQHQSADADREQQEQRQDVLPELLNGHCTVVDHAPPEGQHHAGNHQER